jgi:hypothetical protein
MYLTIACPVVASAQDTGPAVYLVGGTYSAGTQIRPQRNELPKLDMPKVQAVDVGIGVRLGAGAR